MHDQSAYSKSLWNESYMTLSELQKFLMEDGKVPCPDAELIMRKYAKVANRPQTLSFSGFLYFLFSIECSIVKPIERTVHMDMDYPLNHYFINSSHNTYLEGNQLTSNCSADAYLYALQLGSRFVELDVYPGPNGSDPIIKHLIFPTNPVGFREVCEKLRDYAFMYSKYPLILCIEDHCEPDDRAKTRMNEIIQDTFQGQPNLCTSLAKGKFYSLCSDKPIQDTDFVRRAPELVCAFELGETSCEALVEWTKRSQLKVYPGNTQVLSGHFDPRDMWMCGVQYACLNLQTVDQNFIFNCAMFARNGGCGYILKPPYLRPRNGTFFNPLKLETRSKETGEVEMLKKRYLRVHVLGGVHLPRANTTGRGDMVDAYVRVSLFDRIGKSKCQSFRTRVIKDNGFNPVWNEKANFIVDCPDMAFLYFEIFDKDLDVDDLVGVFCVHFASLQSGYVTVPLYDRTYDLLPYASLFVRVNISS